MKVPFFNFAAALGGGKPSASLKGGGNPRPKARAEEGAPPEDDTASEGDGEGEDEPRDDPPGEEENDTASEEEEGDAASEEDGQRDGARAETRAEKQMRARERARIGKIVTSKAASGRIEAALSLAVNTDMPAKAAIALLDTLPKAGASAGGLAARMDKLGSLGVPPGGGDGATTTRSGPLSFAELRTRRQQRAQARG